MVSLNVGAMIQYVVATVMHHLIVENIGINANDVEIRLLIFTR